MSKGAIRFWKMTGIIVLLVSVAFTVYGFKFNLADLPLAHDLAIPAIWGSSGLTFEVVYCIFWLLAAAVSFIGVPITVLTVAYKAIRG